ncbi:MAG: FAD synthetase family protein [Treponema sp.]|nr:FAD synthetase family protein [Treponema sp.]
MKILTWKKFIKDGIQSKERKTSMTVGVFDGVHLGHQALIKKVVSHNADYLPVVITFRKNHKMGMKNTGVNEIQSFEERLNLFGELGIKETIVIDFTDKFKQMPGNDFLETLSEKGNIGFFAVGGNFRCGYKLDTDAKKIEAFFVSRQVPAVIIPEVMEGMFPVSSSRIRAAITDGDTKLAEKMLGRKYTM